MIRMKSFPLALAQILQVADEKSFLPFPENQGGSILTGFCRIKGRKSAIFSFEPSPHAVTPGPKGGQIAILVEESLRQRCPLVGIRYSQGLGIGGEKEDPEESLEILKCRVKCSGTIPQIMILSGKALGGELADWVITNGDHSEMSIASPEEFYEQCRFERNSDASKSHLDLMQRQSPTHLIGRGSIFSGTLLRKLFAYLPSSCYENPPFQEQCDSPERRNPDLEILAKQGQEVPYRIEDVVRSICDRDTFLEVQENCARNLLTGFATLGGYPVGLVANNPACPGAVLEREASLKGARLVRFCNGFNIPVVTLVDGSREREDEPGDCGTISPGSSLYFAYEEMEVACIALILRTASPRVLRVMASQKKGIHQVFSWSRSEADQKNLPQGALGKTIQPSRTRFEVFSALTALIPKTKPYFKHKNFPL